MVLDIAPIRKQFPMSWFSNQSENLKFSNTGKVNPFWGIPDTGKYWNNLINTDPGWWRAPDGLFWICGKWAYIKLRRTWKESCTIGLIQSGFFLLPSLQGEQLGVPLLKTLGPRIKRDQRRGANKDGEKMNGLPRGLLRPMDQSSGHRMRAGITRLLSICSAELLGYRQSWKLLPTRLPLP
jgi:hypothetical protein